MPDLFNVVLSKVDESFTVQETRNYGLAVQFSETSFSYCILDLRRNKYIVLQHLRKNESNSAPSANKQPFDEFLRQVINSMPWLKNPYNSIHLAYEGRKSTLIPGPLFDQSARRNYLQFNFQPTEEEEVLSDHLVPLDNYHVFSIPDKTLSSIRQLYPATVIHHLTSVLIESVWINYKNRINASRVFLHIREKYFDLILFDGRQLSYCNAFPYQIAEDVVYYLIFVLEQLGLNPENIYVILMGGVEKSSGLFDLLTRYVRHIEFGRRNEAFKYSYQINQISPQNYYPLLNFYSCGL